MGGTMIDYVIISMTETLLMDVFEHKPQTMGSERGVTEE